MIGRHARAMVGPTARAVPIAPMLVAFGLGLLVVALIPIDAATTAQLLRLRGVALLFAVAVAFAFDDPTGEVADASPTPRWARAAVRATVQVVPAMTLWVVLLAVLSTRVVAAVPGGRLSFEAGGMVLLGWAVAAWWRRTGGEMSGGVVASPLLIIAVLLAHRLPPRFALFAFDPGTPLWHATQWRWGGLVAVALGALGLALRDPLCRVRRPLPRPTGCEARAWTR